ncbi:MULTISPECIES: MBL fold metallo-hydrolase [Actinokineospora]|uniref:MBL fold metallo-hydrolase n=1 Tax=Actinokineospora fastidiosa TaxID=1816 RepID=A0A918GKS4_9PSEU|nr:MULTISPECIES: MBL fold metallo-hydrolase [Actinokineospora]UVS77454.1 Ribonuclease BN [Actinokineospora sp. UTMC 2448]GGS43199.1 MBL fold metallo-hydrolase [Actinokineospora fastidiosa]
MLLTVLGCSGSLPGPDAPASGYLVEAEGFLLGIELGPGTLAELQSRRDPFQLDALAFSHLHADHCSDFASLAVLRRYHPAPSRDPRAFRLPVFAPSTAPRRLAMAYATSDEELAETDLSDVFEFHALRPGVVEIGPFSVAVAPAAHPCESYSLAITHDGRTLAYTGDTGPNPALSALVAGVDVLLTEASWTHADDRPADLHLSGTQAGELATAAGIGRVLVTHIPPWTDADAVMAEVHAAYDGPAERVEQGVTYTI